MSAEAAVLFGKENGTWQNLLPQEQLVTASLLEQFSDQCELFERLVAADRFNVLNREAANHRVELIELELRLSEVSAARKRFGAVVDAVRQRAKLESVNEVKTHKAEFQACLDAVYAHSHLDEVELTRDAVLVRDRLLAEPVRADLFYSTGQSNVVALALFLGVALRQRSNRLRAVLLDEPIQNLDDLNFLGLMTLLKRIALGSQVIISTADANAAEIIRRQVASTWARNEVDFRWYHWVGFEPLLGPAVERRPVQRTLAA